MIHHAKPNTSKQTNALMGLSDETMNQKKWSHYYLSEFVKIISLPLSRQNFFTSSRTIMAPRTRSRTSGVLKKIKYEDSFDLTEDELDESSPKKRSGRRTHRKRGSDEDSDFVAATASGSSDDDASASSIVERGGVGAQDSSSIDDIPSRRKSLDSHRTRTSAVKPVEKLTRFPAYLLEISLDTLRDSVGYQIRGSLGVMSQIAHLAKQYREYMSSDAIPNDSRKLIELEISSMVLDILRQAEVTEVELFVKSSWIGVKRDVIAAYFHKLKIVAKSLLTNDSMMAIDDSVTEYISYDPKWLVR